MYVPFYRDIVPIISALEYNVYFTSLRASHTRLSHEILERIIHVMKRSLSLEKIVLDSLGVRAEFIHKLATAIITNSDSLLHTIDLSHNLIEDKGLYINKGYFDLCIILYVFRDRRWISERSHCKSQ